MSKFIQCSCGYEFHKEVIAKEVGGDMMTLEEAGKPKGYFGNAAKQMMPIKCPDCGREYLAPITHHYNGYKMLAIEAGGKVYVQGVIDPVIEEVAEAPEPEAPEVKTNKAPEVKKDSGDMTPEERELWLEDVHFNMVNLAKDKTALYKYLKDDLGISGLSANAKTETLIKKAKKHLGME